MIQENFPKHKQVDRVFKNSHFQEIIKAIILGKYAWACVLFLRFSGYDPLEYIPYETYEKLMYDNSLVHEDHQSCNHTKPKNTVFRIY
ncbi:HetP family heterocyst commitment protein [Okeanomitos corallinicola TIOX110]|uniref:HetP family heterocyst commitment protein n=1 Tax=Okeanomitos corallinicola TIOX110 TaxID=3133117 RepID=A0ABZ2UPM5_9CYAN